MKLAKLEILDMKRDPSFNEDWLQKLIADDPGILGIGDVALREREKIQSSGGRLDILLEDQNDDSRYEVEIQLGATDETHIIRTIEYWDNERKKYPQYNHTAVIVAEEITGRFFNVIGLFNGFIPIMAIKVTAVRLPSGEVSVLFTKILDTVTLGGDDEAVASADRNYWETVMGTKEQVALADEILALAKTFVPDVQLNYNRFYISFRTGVRACNFATIKIRKKGILLRIALPKNDEMDQIVEDAGFDSAAYSTRTGYRHVISQEEIDDKKEALTKLLRRAYELRS